MDVMGHAEKIFRADMLRLAEETEVPKALASKIIDSICDVASRFVAIADEMYPSVITRDTLRTIKGCSDKNVARLREGDNGRDRR